MSFDRPRALSSLDEEILRLSHLRKSSGGARTGVGENLIFKILQQRDFNAAWMNVDITTRAVIEESRRKGLAARRQVVADSLRCCVVEDIIPRLGEEEVLYDFSSDFDHRSIGVLQKRTSDGPNSSSLVRVRRQGEEEVETLVYQDVNVALGSYLDIFSTEDLHAQLPCLEDGSLDYSNILSVCKTVPWFDEFSETVSAKELLTVAKLSNLCRVSFTRLKSLYSKLCLQCAAINNNYWTGKASQKLRILNNNFPRGIAGFRALIGPDEPRHIRAMLIKQTDKSHYSQMMTHKKFEDKDREKEVLELDDSSLKESKYASIPDLKYVWQTDVIFPRVMYLDRNRIVPNMVRVEREYAELTSAWSLLEIKVFLERIAVHAKNFKRVSLAIPDKTEKDCVDLYYRFKVHLNMKQIIAAGIQSRQDRTTSNYRGLIDTVVSDLEKAIGPSGQLFSHSQLTHMNLDKMRGFMSKNSNSKINDTGEESPRKERRAAIIDILVNVLGKGYPVPPQLGSLVESTMTSPAITPSLAFYVPSVSSTPRPTLSVIQSEVTVLPSSSRELQAHHTI